ncbi:hypothetical protein KFL_002960120 [Klebsormidium nitens]|uniref:Uncharacterized protein n=1 Tax=Klebsormidium nitens TaxID=105231 RepID=A0A1Y1ICV5_KLENI|nr:hypothetical protein KFL_002960120 [Klebsormidium nitens]|eukprot:GAQ86557.1 hypothetical protein KFL_002960120 [Klebsormidium nitens]
MHYFSKFAGRPAAITRRSAPNPPNPFTTRPAMSRRRADSSGDALQVGAHLPINQEGAPGNATGLKAQKGVNKENYEERLRTAPPSVVIPWVLDDVADSLTETDALRRGVTWEQHAARLRVCWQEYGAEFPKEFAEALTRFLETGDQIDQVVLFLLDIFAGDANEETVERHVTRGSKELWPLVLGELEKSWGEADWTSVPAAESRQRLRQLVIDLRGVAEKRLYSISDKLLDDNPSAKRNAEKLLDAIRTLWLEVERVDREAKKVAIEATLKPAPWEVEGPAGSDSEARKG